MLNLCQQLLYPLLEVLNLTTTGVTKVYAMLLGLGHRGGYATTAAAEGLGLALGLSFFRKVPQYRRWAAALLLFQLEWWAGLWGYQHDRYLMLDSARQPATLLGEGLALEGSLGPALLLLALLFAFYRLLLPLPVVEGRWLTLLCALQLLISGSRDFLTCYLLLETANMVLYHLLAGRWAAGRLSGRPQLRLEPLLGYFLVNLLGSLLLLLGFGFLYQTTGSLAFGEVSLLLRCSPAGMQLVAGQGLALGLLTVLCGLLLKLGLAPFHFWVVPIYEALPHFIYVYLMIFPKGGLLLLLLQWGASLGLNGNHPLLERALLLLAALNLVWGTLGALHQTSLRRLLIYSSLANLSLVLYALAVGGVGVSASGTQYLLLYLLTSASLLLPLGALTESGTLKRWSLPELSRGCHPRLRLLLSLGLLNLSGVPPFGLFFGKVSVALELAERGFGLSLGLLLLFSVVAVGYAFSPLLALWYQSQPRSGVPLTSSTLLADGELPHQLLLAFGVVASMELLEAQPLGSNSDWELERLPLLGLTVLELQLAMQPLLLGLLLLTLWSWQPSFPVAPPSTPVRGLGEGPITNADAENYVDPESLVFESVAASMRYPIQDFGQAALEGKPVELSKAAVKQLLNIVADPYSTDRLLVQHLKLEKLFLEHLQRALSEQWPAEHYTLPDMEPAIIETVAPGVVVSPEECHEFAQNFMVAVSNYGWTVTESLFLRQGLHGLPVVMNRCLRGFPANPNPLSEEDQDRWNTTPEEETPSELLREGCAKACRDLAETLWRREHGVDGPPASAEWVELVSTKCLEGLGKHPQYLAWLYAHSDDDYHVDMPFWEPREYFMRRFFWGETLWYPRLKRDYRIQVEDWVEEAASAVDMPTRRELGIILNWYTERVLKDRLTRKTREQRVIDQRLYEEFGSTPKNRGWYNEDLWEWIAESRSQNVFSRVWPFPEIWDRALRHPWPISGSLAELPTLLLGTALVSLLLGALAATARQLGRSSGRSGGGDRAAAGAYECGFAPFAALSSSSLLLFHRLAVFFVVFEAELIFLFPWAAALPAAAAPGALQPFLAPLGFVLLLFYGYARELRANALKLLLFT